MKQFLLAGSPDKDGIVTLCGDDYHYLAVVRRVKKGSVFPVRVPGGISARAEVLDIDRASLRIKLTPDASGKAPADALPPILLFQALPKGTKMDLIVRQAAEGALSEVVCFAAEHSQLQDAAAKTERWQRIIREGRQQSGSSVDTKFRFFPSQKELLEYWKQKCSACKNPLGIVFTEPGAFTPQNAARAPLATPSFHDYLYKEPDLISLAVGPEGGFSPGEIELFAQAGFKPLRMGNTVLRTETAALYAAAAARIILLEKETWQRK